MVLVSVAAQAPLRKNTHLFSYRERFKLLRHALHAEIQRGCVKLSVLEKYLPKPNYTIDTLGALNALCQADITLVVGADQAQKIFEWHRSEELLARYALLIFSRNKISLAHLPHANFEIIDDFDMPIAATSIRERLALLDPAERFEKALSLLTNEEKKESAEDEVQR